MGRRRMIGMAIGLKERVVIKIQRLYHIYKYFFPVLSIYLMNEVGHVLVKLN